MNAMGILLLAVLMSSSLVAIAYEVPRTSNSSLQVYSDGTLTFDVLFLNWTGFWAFPKVIPAGLYFTDENNGLWSGNDDLIITISPLDEAHVDRRVLHLSPEGVYTNKYEAKALKETPADCENSPPAIASACCSKDDTVIQFDLYQNDTQYVVYNVEVDDDVRQFELSINAALADPGSGQSLREEILSIQPWQSSNVTYAAPLDPQGGPQVSTTTASATSANFSGTVIMGNIGVESYNIFNHDLMGFDFYTLTQTNLSDEGTLVDDYYVDYYDHEGFFAMTHENWAAYRSTSENCAKPLGSPTSLGYELNMEAGWSPYFGAWSNDSSDVHHPYLFSEPLPEPLPNATALDPYNQLGWYDSNVWAFSIGPSAHTHEQGQAQLPLDEQQYGRNTIAANIRANLAYNCSMLFNVPSQDNVSIGDGGQTMKVNMEQAVICEYPNNYMAVSLRISIENAFGFAKFAKAQLGGLEFGASVQILERVSFLESDLKWYPGAKSGWVNLTLISTSNVPQAVTFNTGTCCLTSPSLKCDHVDAQGNFISSGVSAFSLDIVSVPRQESAFASLKVNTAQYGEGYCNVSFSHVYFDGKAIAKDATSQFWGKITFSVPVGPPVSFTVEFYIYYLSMERDTYFLPGPGLGRARPEFQDETDDLETRVSLYIVKAANAVAPGANTVVAWLPETQPMSNFGRRLLATNTPMGIYMRVAWPPEQSNATALNFNSSIPNIVNNMTSSVYGRFGPTTAPLGSVSITTTYAPPPPHQAPPPPPPYQAQPPPPPLPAQSFSSPLPPSPATQKTDCDGQSIDCGAHGDLTAACDCVCQVGWTTQPFQRDGTVRYCMMASNEGTQKNTSLLFGGSSKVGPLGVVVIVVVVVCLMSSSWLCFMMHRRTQASTSKIAQRSIVMFEHERPSEMPRAPASVPGWQLQPQSSTSELLAATNIDRDMMDKECSSWLGEASLPQFQQRHKGRRG